MRVRIFIPSWYIVFLYIRRIYPALYTGKVLDLIAPSQKPISRHFFSEIEACGVTQSSTSLSMRSVPITSVYSRTERVTRRLSCGNGTAYVDEREFRIFFTKIGTKWAKKGTCVIRPERKLHYRKGVPFGISASFPDRDQTGVVRLHSFSWVHISLLFREKMNAWTPTSAERPSKATCVLQPSNDNPRTGNLSIATVNRVPSMLHVCGLWRHHRSACQLGQSCSDRDQIGTVQKRSSSSVHISRLIREIVD